MVGGDAFAGLLDVLKRGGRYAVAGAIAGPVVPLDLRTLYLKDLTLLGCTVRTPPAVFSRLLGLIQEGALRPVVRAVYPLRRTSPWRNPTSSARRRQAEYRARPLTRRSRCGTRST